MINYFFPIFIIFAFASCNAKTTQYIEFPEASKDDTQATVYMIRPTDSGAILKTSVYHDFVLVGRLGPKSYLAWNLDPSLGETVIRCKIETTDLVYITPQAGETYYIRQKLKPGFPIAQPKLKFMDPQKAQKKLAKLKKPALKSPY